MKPSELLADPKAWTKGAYGRDKDGDDAGSFCEDAVSWCAAGAINRCCDNPSAAKSLFREYLQDKFGDRSIPNFNDAPERTHAEVLEALKACGL